MGTLGTLIGAGGGFILVPCLLYLYPQQNPDSITAISLAIVFLNAGSGSLAYAQKKKIDYKSALIFSFSCAPGAIIGAYVTSFIPRRNFEVVFGVILIFISLYLLLKRSVGAVQKPPPRPHRVLIDSHGESYIIGYNVKLGIFISAIVGFISSLLGIGGGIIHVPAMIDLLYFPVHIATATSHFVLAISALIGTFEHVWHGHLVGHFPKIAALGITVILGAQLGAYLSPKVNGRWIVKCLAVALLLVGIRLL